MPVSETEQAEWLARLDREPIETATAVAALVQHDVHYAGAGSHVRVGTRILTEVAARSYVSSLLTSVDEVEVAALARKYITTAVIEPDGAEPLGIDIDN